MGTILDQIIREKRKEIIELQAQPLPKETIYTPFSIEQSLVKKIAQANQVSVIAEFKRASPSKGLINSSVSPDTQAQAYLEAGADAISVLTDQHFFKGSFDDLEVVRFITSAPILCKDFIIDPIQIRQAKQKGASLILLIAAALTKEELHRLYQYAKELGLEVLMEVHNEEELQTVLSTDNLLVGINNRNLKTFEVDLAVTEQLAPMVVKAGRFAVSESGLINAQDVARVVNAGASAVLVGESFMRHNQPSKLVEEMKKIRLKKVHTP